MTTVMNVFTNNCTVNEVMEDWKNAKAQVDCGKVDEARVVSSDGCTVQTHTKDKDTVTGNEMGWTMKVNGEWEDGHWTTVEDMVSAWEQAKAKVNSGEWESVEMWVAGDDEDHDCSHWEEMNDCHTKNNA